MSDYSLNYFIAKDALEGDEYYAFPVDENNEVVVDQKSVELPPPGLYHYIDENRSEVFFRYDGGKTITELDEDQFKQECKLAESEVFE